MNIRRGYLYTADLNPRFGTEPGKTRPVFVLQTDFMNGTHLSTLICPLTTKVKPQVELLRVHFREGEGGLKAASDLLVDQIRAIDNQRLIRQIGKASPARLKEIEEKVKIALDLP